ncbi:MAG: glycosyltransferase family protein [Reyranellales bacterium]
MSARVFFYVQHLLGIGHLRRAATLARALAAGGFDVLLVSGGGPTPLDLGAGRDLGVVRFHQLPPVRARDEGLRELTRLDGTPLDEAFRAARCQELVGLLRTEAPDILITEQYPFGRTQLRFELVPLVAAARAMTPRPLIVSSIRDVLRRTASSERVAETVETFEAFDFVLIHADPELVGLERSFAAWDRIKARAVYTGYVTESDLAPKQGDAGKGEVVVSVGGGAVGLPLLKAAVAARPLSALADRPWRLLVGANMPAAALDTGDGVTIEPARADFITLLRNSVLSISQAGYNTVIETLCCADRAVLVPFGTARESEQTDRAQLLAERGMLAVVPHETLSPESLAAAVERALSGPSIRSFPPCNASGASATVEFLRAHLS